MADDLDDLLEEFGVAGVFVLADEGGEVLDGGVDDLGGDLVLVAFEDALEGVPVVGREDSGRGGGT